MLIKKIPAVAPLLWVNRHKTDQNGFDFIERIYGAEPNRLPFFIFHLRALDNALAAFLTKTTYRYAKDVNWIQKDFWQAQCVGQGEPADLPKEKFIEKDGRYYFNESFASYYKATGRFDPEYHGNELPEGLKSFVTGHILRPEALPWPEGIRVPMSYLEYSKTFSRLQKEDSRFSRAKPASPAQFFCDVYSDLILEGKIYTHQLQILDSVLHQRLAAVLSYAHIKLSDVLPSHDDCRKLVWQNTFDAPLPDTLKDLPEPNRPQMHARVLEFAGKRDPAVPILQAGKLAMAA